MNVSEYIKDEINLIIAQMKATNMLDVEFSDDVLMDEVIFTHWDNISTELYLGHGGTMEVKNPNYPTNERMFNDCQNDASELIERTRLHIRSLK